MTYRHRRAPSNLQLAYEDTLESPNNEPASMQLPLKELNFKETNEKDFYSHVRKWVSKSEQEPKDEAEKVLICENIEDFSDAETEDPLDELNEMMKKILNQRMGKRNELDGKRKGIKMNLCNLVAKEEPVKRQNGRHVRKNVKFQEF